jgi:hypothetical protein
MHAVHDACVPHHAAGYLGNWHGNYEDDLERGINIWLAEENLKDGVKDLIRKWGWEDPLPPSILLRNDYDRRPAINWDIDHLVTWLALNAYREYDRIYNHFRNGYSFNEDSARELTREAVAMSVLVLRKAVSASF